MYMIDNIIYFVYPHGKGRILTTVINKDYIYKNIILPL